MLDNLLKLHREAPKFIAEYENKQRSLAAKLHLYAKVTCQIEKNFLASWIDMNNKWLHDNSDKYNQSKRVVLVDPKELEELMILHERVVNG